VRFEIILPVHALHAEIKDFLVLRVQSRPQRLHIFVVEIPLLRAEVCDHVGEALDLLVHFQHPKIKTV